jgi:protein gp37
MSKIQWTDRTWNPVVGCQINSPECLNCYAKELAQTARMQQFAQYQEVKNWDKAVFVENQLLKPLRWKTPSMVFLSMGDLFFHTITDEEIDRIFAICALTPRHTYQFLTKFPIRMQKYIQQGAKNRVRMMAVDIGREQGLKPEIYEPYETCDFDWPLPNVWLGTSVGLQNSVEQKVPWLRKTHAAVRFLSCEPLLEMIDLRSHLHEISWVVVGGESGDNARPCHIDWIRSIVDQCQVNNVPVFVKQLGAVPIASEVYIFDTHSLYVVKLKDRKGGELSEFPTDLQHRQFPTSKNGDGASQ